MLLGGRRKQQPTINGSVKGDGRPGQEQQGSGWQRSVIRTDSRVGDTTTNHRWKSAAAAAAATDDADTGEDDAVVFCIVVIVDNDDDRVLGISPLEMQ
jgi:hypothetical protein